MNVDFTFLTSPTSGLDINFVFQAVGASDDDGTGLQVSSLYAPGFELNSVPQILPMSVSFICDVRKVALASVDVSSPEFDFGGVGAAAEKMGVPLDAGPGDRFRGEVYQLTTVPNNSRFSGVSVGNYASIIRVRISNDRRPNINREETIRLSILEQDVAFGGRIVAVVADNDSHDIKLGTRRETTGRTGAPVGYWEITITKPAGVPFDTYTFAVITTGRVRDIPSWMGLDSLGTLGGED
jgi:hypothetical protein